MNLLARLQNRDPTATTDFLMQLENVIRRLVIILGIVRVKSSTGNDGSNRDVGYRASECRATL